MNFILSDDILDEHGISINGIFFLTIWLTLLGGRGEGEGYFFLCLKGDIFRSIKTNLTC